MSQESVEVVRDSVRAFAEGGLAAMAQFWAADIDWRAMEGALDDVGEIRGPAALRAYYQDWIDTFDDIAVVAEELRDAGDGRVVATQHVTGRAKASRVETELRYAASTPCATGRSSAGASTSTTSPRSKPPGCGSRRCRGRTWRSCDEEDG